MRNIDVFPGWMRSLWNACEIRVMVILSLFLQIVLIFFGHRRKYISSNWVRIILWIAYMSADWVATVALGVLSNQQGDNSEYHDFKSQLPAFWAPILLLHLGGPDNVTAYALEDNELWLRHLLGLIVQLGVAIYIFLMSWRGNWLSFLNIPMFLAGIIKYGERTWVLMSASREHFRDSMLSLPDSGPNYANFMEEYSSKKNEGFHVTVGLVDEVPPVFDPSVPVENKNPDASTLLDSHYFFNTFKRLFADLILSFQDRDNSRSFFLRNHWKVGFNVIEVELGFVYDLLYTKAALVYTPLGFILRSISFSSTISVFIVYLVSEKHRYHVVDRIITYLLLGVAVLLEIYAMIRLLFSDWTIAWLIKHKKNEVMTRISQYIYSFPLRNNRRWSNSMSQYNLIGFCFKENKPTYFRRIQQFIFINKLLEKYYHKTSEEVSDNLKASIYQQLKEKSESATLYKDFHWTITIEFDRSILIWHIATTLCYYSDDPKKLTNPERAKCQNSKLVSDYMLYLLVMCPFMLPIGIGQIRFRDTCAEAIEFFQEKKSISNTFQACKMLLQVNTEIPPIQVKGDRSKSVLFDACRLAKSLQSLEISKKWNLISEVWVERLSYAANQCRGNYHAQQLRRGGELLTHVWLLMAHLGITEQFQISQGHARAKLIVE